MVHCSGAKKGDVPREKNGFHRGAAYSSLRSGGRGTARVRRGKKSSNRCSGRAAVAEVAGQLHCPVIIRCCRRVQQSLGPALLKFSSLHPVLKHGSRSLAV